MLRCGAFTARNHGVPQLTSFNLTLTYFLKDGNYDAHFIEETGAQSGGLAQTLTIEEGGVVCGWLGSKAHASPAWLSASLMPRWRSMEEGGWTPAAKCLAENSQRQPPGHGLRQVAECTLLALVLRSLSLK